MDSHRKGVSQLHFASSDEIGSNGDRSEHQHWQALLDSAGEGICGIDVTGNCTFVNRMASNIFGFTPDEMLGKKLHSMVHHHRDDGSEYPAEECPIQSVLNGHQPLRQSMDTMFRKDGSSFLAEMSAQPVTVDGAVMGVVVTFRDVSERQQQQQELRRAYELAEQRTAELDAVIESIPHGIFIATKEGKVRSNGRAREMTGESFPKELLTLDRALGGEHSTETVCSTGPASEQVSTAGSKRWIRSVAAPIISNGQILGGVAVNTDITLARLQEDALRKAEKLAAVGQLASSIAHEINNPLESITNLLYLLRNSSSMDEVQEYARLAQGELARVTEITLQTLKFHRQQSRPAPVGLGELIETILSLYTGRFLVRGITLEKRLLATPKVFCFEGEIRQVLNNLIRNAIDAMSESGSLKMRLRAGSGKHGERGVRITIADTGEGISPEIAGHLFEPFQTTKELTGTGLGLWVSKGIIDKHGGKICVRTRRGAPSGTVFSLWLPEDGDTGLFTTSEHETDDPGAT